MKKKILISLVLFAVVTTLGFVMNLSETQCNHSLNGHDCSEHLALVDDFGERCPSCLQYKDEWNACICDYETCGNCGEWKLLKNHNFCTHCGEIAPVAKCEKCNKPKFDCDCE